MIRYWMAQEDLLRGEGCETILTGKISGTVAGRSEPNEVKKLLQQGNTLVVWQLDRLGSSLKDILDNPLHLKIVSKPDQLAEGTACRLVTAPNDAG